MPYSPYIYFYDIDDPDEDWDEVEPIKHVYGSSKYEEDEDVEYWPECFYDAQWWWTGEQFEQTTLELFNQDSVDAALARWNRNNPVAVWSVGTISSATLMGNWSGVNFSATAVRVTLELEGCAGEYLIRYYLERRHVGGGPGDWVRDTQPYSERVEVSQASKNGRVTISFLLPVVEGVEIRVSDSLNPLTPVYEVVDANAAPSTGAVCKVSQESVHWAVSMGFGDLGYSMGSLSIDAQTITPEIYTPAILRYGAPSASATVIYENVDEIRQIRVPQGLVDVLPLSVGEGFTISFYYAEDIDEYDPISGLYELKSGATPFVVWTVDNPDMSGSERVRIAQTTGNTGEVYIYAYDDINDSWSLDKGGLVYEELTEVISGSDIILTRAVRESALDPVVAKSRSTYREYPWGTEKISEVLSPDVDSQTTSWDFYDNELADGAAYGKLKSVQYPDGSWARYEYDNEGRMSKIVSPWLDSEITTTSDAAHRVREITYTTDTVNTEDVRIETEVTLVLGEETSRSFLVIWVEGSEESGTRYHRQQQIQAHEPGADWDDVDNLVTETWNYWEGDFIGKPWRILNPDGTMILYAYGVDRSGAYPGDPIGQTWTVSRGEPALNLLSVVKGTLEQVTTDSAGNQLYSRSMDIETGLSLGNSRTTQQDDLGRPTRIDYEDDTFELRSYSCCGLASRTSREGIETTYEYDDLKRLVRTTTAGVGTAHVYDAAGNVIEVLRIGSDDTPMTQSKSGYDLSGRVIWQEDALARKVEYEYSLGVGGGAAVETTYLADSGTVVETRHRDGRLLSVEGTATFPREYAYGVITGGAMWTQETAYVSSLGSPWVKTWTNALGQMTRREYPDSAEELFVYDQAGRLIQQTDADGVQTLFGYNTLGEQDVVAVDMDRNGVIDYDGTDRITRTTRSVVAGSSGFYGVRRTETQAWAYDYVDSPTVIGASWVSINGRESSQTGVVPWLTTSSETFLSGGGDWVTYITYPDYSSQTSYYEQGRLVSAVRYDRYYTVLSETLYEYDVFGRQISMEVVDIGTTTYTWYADDQMATITSPDPDPLQSGPGFDAQVTSYTYNGRGWLSKVTHPDSTETHTTYYPTGNVKRVWGSRAYPVEYTYDAQGKQETMTTWQDLGGNSGQAVTTWNYSATRGWLDNKKYEDDEGPAYTYTPAGRLDTRTWARGVVTTYAYNDAGDLEEVTYSDSTPSVSHTYDRLGNVHTTTDAAGVLTRTYMYDVGPIADEVYSGTGILSGESLYRWRDDIMRVETLNVSSLDMIEYYYDGASRLETLMQWPRSVTYDYHPVSGLVSSVTVDENFSEISRMEKSYDLLGRVTRVDTYGDGSNLYARRDYVYNDANQRIRMKSEDDRRWVYDYDALGQVVLAEKRLSDDTTVLPGYAYGYSYDDIGNRVETVTNGRTADYTPNLLNQYTEREYPGALDARGVANAGFTVEVNGVAATRTGADYYGVGTFNNSSAAVLGELEIEITDPGPPPVPQPPEVYSLNATGRTDPYVIPETPEEFVYDLDGNLIADGRWDYVWDGENRLVSMTIRSKVSTEAGMMRLRLLFDYDSSGRRIRTKTEIYIGYWMGLSEERYLYDGWNMVAELAGMGINRAMVWGPDLSGTEQGAGGVGGLLWTVDGNGDSMIPGYDGNGNIIAWIDASDGSLAGTREYGAFGEDVTFSGVSHQIPYGFSTKYQDHISGLYYYGYRYYNASSGRWLNRDPIEEQGGLNLYAFVGNNGVDYWDYLGWIQVFENNRFEGTSTITGLPANTANPLGRGTGFGGGVIGVYGSSMLNSVRRVLPNSIGSFSPISWTFIWVPYPGGNWRVEAGVSGAVVQCCKEDGGYGKMADVSVTISTYLSIGYGAGGNRGMRRDNRINNNTKLRDSRGRFAANPGIGRNQAGARISLASSSIPKCKTSLNGSITFEIGAIAGAILSANIYANISTSFVDPISFQYGSRVGVSGYLGAELYLMVSAEGSGFVDISSDL